jgi:predicted TIM-barrel fold metal-dependent hydrolase
MAAVSHSNAIDAVLTLAPATRLLFGSDHPFILQNVISEGIEFILSSNKINEATRARLCNENAHELFPRLNKID